VLVRIGANTPCLACHSCPVPWYCTDRHLRGRAGWWQPEESAGLLSRLFFSYCNGILAMGSRKILVQDDLWDVSRCVQPCTLSRTLTLTLALILTLTEALHMSSGPGCPPW